MISLNKKNMTSITYYDNNGVEKVINKIYTALQDNTLKLIGQKDIEVYLIVTPKLVGATEIESYLDVQSNTNGIIE